MKAFGIKHLLGSQSLNYGDRLRNPGTKNLGAEKISGLPTPDAVLHRVVEK